MKAGWQIGVLASLPNRVEVRMVEQLVFDVPRQIDARDPWFARDLADQFGCTRAIAHRDHGNALETRRIGGAIRGEPAMICANHCDLEIDGLERAEARHNRRE